MGGPRRNLLQETSDFLQQCEKSPTDVLWVGSRNGMYAMPWQDFEKLADVAYDAGYGGQQIMADLVVVGGDWWLERGEYDGSEWWDFKTLPTRKNDSKPFTTVNNGEPWASLEETHGGTKSKYA